ncbi:MAG: hypothetical protein D6773_03575 [Alphaproteobacteria bacterium]|nr:MAG: hypothetical protein D6773_03575 [Alphaproteobacteria bacterium]
MLLIFLFCAMPQRLVPPWLVFLAGLATDILTAGPAGYWAMIYLLTYTLARQFAGGRRLRGAAHIWLSFAATGALAGACAWAIASLYYFRLIEWQPIAFGVGAAVGLLPLAAWLVRHPAFRSRRRVRGGWQMPAGEAK